MFHIALLQAEVSVGIVLHSSESAECTPLESRLFQANCPSASTVTAKGDYWRATSEGEGEGGLDFPDSARGGSSG